MKGTAPLRTIDLNGDLGESFGVYRIGQDEALLDQISSANIACGYHAGDPAVMRRTVKLCLEKGVAIGAHPGLPDLAGFGRRMMRITPEEAHDMVLYQIGALQAFVRAEGGRMQHVKPHGALYNMAATDRRLADAIAQAVSRFDPQLMLYGLSGSELIRAAEAAGLRAVAEAFADRTYRADGTLTPRDEPGAVLHDAGAAAEQVLRIIREGKVATAAGADMALHADTFCVHGDGPEAAALVARLRAEMKREGIAVNAPSRM